MKHDVFENIEIKILNVLKKFKYKLIQFYFIIFLWRTICLK